MLFFMQKQVAGRDNLMKCLVKNRSICDLNYDHFHSECEKSNFGGAPSDLAFSPVFLRH
jgi:hypothetical protein